MKKVFISLLIILTGIVSVYASGHTVSIISSANALCFGSCDGQATANASGGVGPYTYNWSGPLGYTATGATAINLCAGTYTVTATDQNDMSTATVNVAILEPTQLVVSIVNTTNAYCGMPTGSATFIVTGGTPAYQYNFMGVGNLVGNTYQGLSAGNYFLIVTDVNGCTASTIVTITEAPPISLTINSSGQSCGNCNGTATAIITGGTPPYAYFWNTGYSGAFHPNLCAGNYNVTVTDSYGCTANGNFTITNSPGFTINTTITQASCGNADGMACSSVSGGSPPYAYLWSNGSTAPCNNNVSAGWYYLSVYDNTGCMQDTAVEVMNSNGVNIVLDSIVNINCNNNSVGSISIHGVGGTGIYHYLWSNGDTTATISNLNPGYYTVLLYDSDSCTSQAVYHLINSYNLYASIQATNANCTNNGMAIMSVSGLHPPFTFLWNDPLNQTTQTALNLSAGNYQVTITDANGCSIIASTHIYSNGYNVIKGRIYLDANQNCIQDVGEPGLSNISLGITPGSSYGYTNSLGDYTILTTQTNGVISVYPYNVNNYTPTCPLSETINFNFTSSCDSSFSNDFGYWLDPNAIDLIIHPGWSAGHPGFDKHYWICYYNNSATPQNALIRFTYDPALVYLYCTQGGIHYPIDHKIEWTFNNLQPSNGWDWSTKPEIYFNVPTTVTIYDTICSYFEILPIVGDIHPNNNSLNVCEHITGSMDPNSKDVIPRGQGAPGYILQTDSVLLYTLHFQNTGNDTCFTVVIKDTLSQHLDPATIVPGASSHPYIFTLSEHGILTFRFNQIMLPYSNVNESASNGYVNYTVNLKPNLPIGTEIENTGYIFFDFNSPVVTNSTINTIASPAWIREIANNISVSVFPNPFSDYTMFEIQNGKSNSEYSIDIYDMLGKCVKSINNISEKNIKVSAKGIESGIYMYKVIQNKEIIGTGKLIIE